MNFPTPLQTGSRVALLAPASGIGADAETRQKGVDKSVQALNDLGLEAVVYPSCLDNYGYLAATDRQRANDVMDAFCDDSIDGIWCLRGGYGVQRMLDLLDINEIKKHPKWFGGYSDITALHIVLNQQAELVTFHCPMPSTEVANGVDAYTMTWLKQALFGRMQGELPQAAEKQGELHLLREGDFPEISGPLCGGNLSLVSSSLGTPYEIDTGGKILFLEDIYEGIYRIDGMLNHMRLAGKFRDAAAIVLGYWSEVPEEKSSMTLEQMLKDLLPADKPVLVGYSCGHERPTMTLPLGQQATLKGTVLSVR